VDIYNLPINKLKDLLEKNPEFFQKPGVIKELFERHRKELPQLIDILYSKGIEPDNFQLMWALKLNMKALPRILEKAMDLGINVFTRNFFFTLARRKKVRGVNEKLVEFAKRWPDRMPEDHKALLLGLLVNKDDYDLAEEFLKEENRERLCGLALVYFRERLSDEGINYLASQTSPFLQINGIFIIDILPKNIATKLITAKTLDWVFKNRDKELLEKVLDAIGDPNYVDEKEFSLLHLAVLANWTEGLLALLKRGATPNILTPHFSPLTMAAIRERKEMIQILRYHEADVNKAIREIKNAITIDKRTKDRTIKLLKTIS
jgi:ankyrin repeat protein